MQGIEATTLDVCTTFLAGSVESVVEALQSLVDGGQLVLSGIVNRLQGLVVLQLDRPVAPIADQRIVATLEVPRYAGMALFQSVASRGEQLLDLADVVLLS